MKYERCCKCDCATGKAGAGEDSLYTETDGPFCEKCFPEKQEQGEPVAYCEIHHLPEPCVQCKKEHEGYNTKPQPSQKPLTDEQIGEIFATQRMVYNSNGVTFARAIEAAHGIKE